MIDNIFKPSLLIPEVYFPFKTEDNFTANIVERLSEEGFYKSFEIGDGYKEGERKRILFAAETHDIEITQWLTFLIDKNNLDVSSLDRSIRTKSVKDIVASLYHAAECGASNIAFITGEYQEEKHNDQMEGLYESLCEITEGAKEYGMKVLLEPLDRFAHKKRIIGPTNEAVNLIKRVKETNENIGLAFDTAHAALNGESVLEAVKLAEEEISQIHFSNAVLDPRNPLYGDHHMDIGEPGFLTIESMVEILDALSKLNLKNEKALRVAVEVRGSNQEDYLQNEKNVNEILKVVLNKYKNKGRIK